MQEYRLNNNIVSEQNVVCYEGGMIKEHVHSKYLII